MSRVRFCFWPPMVPVGVMLDIPATAACTSCMEMPRAAMASGLSRTRTAYFWPPKMLTWATPGSWETCWLMMVSAYSCTSESGNVSEITDRNSTGASAGFTLRKLGGTVISIGSWRCATDRADCTSSAALSMLRARSNCTTIEVEPVVLVDEIEVMPAMVASWRSIGVATDAAMVSGLAPGSAALIWMVGKSTRGSAATGNSR